MIFLLAILATVGLVILVVPAIATSVARTVVQGMDRGPSSGSIDQELVEARLGRIEEAIDAMAAQIERLGEQQRAFLGAPREAATEAGGQGPGPEPNR